MPNEDLKPTTEAQIFPRYPQKTYGLMEMMKGTTTIVGKGGEQDSVLSWPNLVVLEFILALGASVTLLFWSLVQNAPLTELANPDVTENPAKAPWYFLGLQELLLHMHPSLAGVLIPTLLIVLLIALPYFDRNTRDVGIWFASGKGRVMAAFSFLFAVLWIIALVLLDVALPFRVMMPDPMLPIFDNEFWEQIVPGWIYPISVMGFLILFLMVFLKIVWQPNLREMVVAIFSAFVGVLVMLTIFGTWFRGVNMLLRPPSEVLVTGLDFTIGPLFGLALAIIMVWWIQQSEKEGTGTMSHPHGQSRKNGVTRRSFLSYAWWGAFGLMSAQAAAAAGVYFWPKIREGGFGSVVPAGNVAELPPVGAMVYFSEAQFYLSHVPEGIIAMWRKCPHLGCVVPWEPDLPSLDDIAPTGRFACPCHNSQYNRYGEIISGPAPRPLDYFPIEIEDDGTLLVDTGTVIERPAGLDIETQITPV